MAGEGFSEEIFQLSLECCQGALRRSAPQPGGPASAKAQRQEWTKCVQQVAEASELGVWGADTLWGSFSQRLLSKGATFSSCHVGNGLEGQVWLPGCWSPARALCLVCAPLPSEQPPRRERLGLQNTHCSTA